jgi:hypothetical protein
MFKVQVEVPRDTVRRMTHLRRPPTTWRTIAKTGRVAKAERIAERLRIDNPDARVRMS